MRWATVWSLMGLVLLGSTGALAVPRTLSHQGILTEAGGGVVPDDDYELTFRIYDAQQGGTALWTETRTVSTTNGVFSTMLGQMNPIDLAFDVRYWLGVTLAGGQEMSPRLELGATPYAFRAAVAESLAGGGAGGDEDWHVVGDDMYAGVPGNVGIGTTSPAAKLELSAPEDTDLLILATSGTPRFALTAHGSGPDYMSIRPKLENPDTDVLVIRGDGRVGIGTTAPGEELDVAGTVKMTGLQMTTSPTAGHVLTADASGNASWQPPSELALPFSGSSDHSPSAFAVTNTAGGSAINGASQDGTAILGRSIATGNFGYLGGANGVYGGHGAGGTPHGYLGGEEHGVYGYTDVDGANGVRGESSGSGPGVYGANTASGQTGRLGGGYYGVKAEGDLVVTGAYKGTIGPNDGAPFPRPAYDSWWQPIDPGEVLTLDHGIGGDVTSYVVDMEFKNSGSQGINAYAWGGWADWSGPGVGAHWFDLTSEHIKVNRWNVDSAVEQVRIRIWVYN